MLKYKFTKQEDVISYVNKNLKDYDGYIQFSHRVIDLDKDIFPKVEDITNEKGFVYEAHFCKGSKSIMIRQINEKWLISETDISSAEPKTFHGIADLKIKMAQIWESKADELCAGMEVMKLQKVVFAGFEKGETK